MSRTARLVSVLFILHSICLVAKAFGVTLSADGQPVRYVSDNLDSYALAPPVPWLGDLDGMRERRMVRILVPYCKTFYFIDGAKQLGLGYEAGKGFESWLNRNNKTKAASIHVVFIPVARDALLRGLAQGLGDIAVGKIAITSERQKQVEFAIPTMTGVRLLVVTGPSTPKLASLKDLAGKTVYVRRSSSSFEYLIELDGQLKHERLQKIEVKAIDENLEDEDVLEMVNAGLLPMTIVDEPTADLWARIFNKLDVRRDLTIKGGVEFGWTMRRNSPLLAAQVNEFVKAHKLGTKFGNILLRRYNAEKFIKTSTASRDRKRFEGVVAIFQKYAGLYDFDYLMLAAMGYQESQLDQSRRSKRGAVGIMQIMPRTASNPPVAIRNVRTSADANISAGTKYLRFVTEKYLNDPKIDNQNRLLLAFAAYNAGPGNLLKLRRIAQDSGLDQNVWFDNVEIAAARAVGDETVEYVRNIYKYYVAYKLLTEREQERKQARHAARLSR